MAHHCMVAQTARNRCIMARQAVLGMDQGSFGYGLKPVFTNVSLLLDDARTALVGENGAGKSTLLKCLSGELELNRGKLLRSRNLRVGSLPQETPADLGCLTVRAVLGRSLEKIGAEAEDWRIDVLLDEIGLAPQTAEAPFETLSGGWRRLVMIAGVARLEDPDLLVLDEPTNHLDLGHIAILERWLTIQFKLPMLIASHDRAFLDRVTDRTLFLRSDGVQAFKVGFSQAREALLRLDASRARQRNLEEKEVRRLEQAAQAGFAVRRLEEPAGDFSHGERTRLAFLRMKLMSPNLYLLDEPTNHLDIEGQEALETELEDGDVSCVFVSHDRYFVRGAATRFVEITKGRLVEVEDPDTFFLSQETTYPLG